MGWDLTPRVYLEMLTEEYEEYREHWHAHRYQVSIRKAINCCGLANALPEIVLAHYGVKEPQKVHNKTDKTAYRRYLRAQCEAHHTVRDICDYSKHGPKLTHRHARHPDAVLVQNVKPISREEGFSQGFPFGVTQSQEVERLVIRYQNGREELMDEILEQVIASWNTIFDQDKL